MLIRVAVAVSNRKTAQVLTNRMVSFSLRSASRGEDIEFDFSSLSIPGLVISSITELGGNTLVLTDKDTYSGVITLADMDSSTVNTVRVSISWQNDEANNEVDSSWGMVADKVISIPVNVKLTQYLGEELPVYVE